MAEIINLRQVRKQRKRMDKEAQAAANRRKHGRTKSARQAEDLEERRSARELDGKRCDAVPSDSPTGSGTDVDPDSDPGPQAG